MLFPPQILTDTSLQKVKRNQNCLEPCVRQLVSCLESDMVRSPRRHRRPLHLVSSLQLCLLGGCLCVRCRRTVRHPGPSSCPTPSLRPCRPSLGSPTRTARIRSHKHNTATVPRGGTGNRLFIYLLCIRMPTSHSLGPLAPVSAALVVWCTSPGQSPCTALPRPPSPLPGKNTGSTLPSSFMFPSQKVVFKLRGWYFRLSLSGLKLPSHLCDSTAQAQVLHTEACVPPA